MLLRAMVGLLSNTLKKAVRRVGCALRKTRAPRVVEGERTQTGQNMALNFLTYSPVFLSR